MAHVEYSVWSLLSSSTSCGIARLETLVEGARYLGGGKDGLQMMANGEDWK